MQEPVRSKSWVRTQCSSMFRNAKTAINDPATSYSLSQHNSTGQYAQQAARSCHTCIVSVAGVVGFASMSGRTVLKHALVELRKCAFSAEGM